MLPAGVGPGSGCSDSVATEFARMPIVPSIWPAQIGHRHSRSAIARNLYTSLEVVQARSGAMPRTSLVPGATARPGAAAVSTVAMATVDLASTARRRLEIAAPI